MIRLRQFMVGLCFLVAACAPLDEDEIAAREYERAEFRARFLEYREACEAEGGYVVIRSRRRIAPDRVARPGDEFYCDNP